MCAGAKLLTQPGSLRFCLSPHFLLVQSLKVSQRLRRLGLSQVFSKDMPNAGHVCGLLQSQEFMGALQNHYTPKHLIPSLPSPNFSACLLFAPTVIPFSRHQWLMNLPSNVLQGCHLHPGRVPIR